MNGRKNVWIMFGFVLSVSLMVSALSVLTVSGCYSRLQFNLLNSVCSEILEQEPGTEQVLSAALKAYAAGIPDHAAKGDILTGLGYRISDFASLSYRQSLLCAAAGFLAGTLLFILTFFVRNKKENRRIRAVTEYLEQVNTGKAAILSPSGEDEFSKLEDEITISIKTVTFLYQTKDTAVQAKNRFADNLWNIAHQIKTPITAISLSVQMMREDGRHREQIRSSLGGLRIWRKRCLYCRGWTQAHCFYRKVRRMFLPCLCLLPTTCRSSLRRPAFLLIFRSWEMQVFVDPDWTMEAVMNLMKNCMEHGEAHGTIHCSYEQNPLYTQILIWDEGKGFSGEDIPHLFERFYRGQNAGEGGIGIGLALSKEIIEAMTIRAGNRQEGGACFEIRFYSH